MQYLVFLNHETFVWSCDEEGETNALAVACVTRESHSRISRPQVSEHLLSQCRGCQLPRWKTLLRFETNQFAVRARLGYWDLRVIQHQGLLDVRRGVSGFARQPRAK